MATVTSQAEFKAAIEANDLEFTISNDISPAASLAAGGTTSVTIRSVTGLNASATPYSGTLKITLAGDSGSTGITQSLLQTVNKASTPTGTTPSAITIL